MNRMANLAGPFRRAGRSVLWALPNLNFITIHYTVFILTSIIAAIVLWGSSTPARSISFTDALFLTVSAITEAGLNTVNLSELNSFQQAILFLLIFAGSSVFVSGVIVFIRLKAFEKAFKDIKKKSSTRKSHHVIPSSSETKTFTMTRAPSAKSTTSRIQGTSNTRPSSPGSRVMGAADVREIAHNANIYANSIDRNKEEESQVSVDQEHAINRHDDLGYMSSGMSDIGHSELRGADADAVIGSTINKHIDFDQETRFRRQRDSPTELEHRRSLFSFSGVGASGPASLRPRSSSISAHSSHNTARVQTLTTMYNQKKASKFTATGWMSRNSQFHGLTMREREMLGGHEYRSILLLSWLVPFYIIVWQLLGSLAVGAWVNSHQSSTAYEDGIKPWWVGSFMVVSLTGVTRAFNNSGMSLLDANLVAFQNSIFVLISLSLLILAGNTAYPIFLRLAIWSAWKFLPKNNPRWADEKESLRFLLDHPRRVYTNLFLSSHTWWLLAVLIVLNGLDWAFFELLSIGDQDIEKLSPVARILGGLTQAFAVRSGGFYVFPIPNLRLSLQFLYTVMMYISVYPVTITIRNSNVYEERSLGIFAEDLETESQENQESIVYRGAAGPPLGMVAALKRRVTGLTQTAASPKTREKASFFIRQQLRSQLAHDAWFSVVAIFIILIIENSQLDHDPVNFSVFDVIFEVVSAYATVGLSVGVPNNAYSFSGSWHILSKLVLCAVMLRGRHRGLPVAIDHAIQLPGRKLWVAEDEDGERRVKRMEWQEQLQDPE